MNRFFWLLAAAAVAAIPPVAAHAAGGCFKLDGQSYCSAWSAKDATMMKAEYVRSGETVDRWQRMVTIIRFNDVHTLAGATSRYMAMVGNYIDPPGSTPQWVTAKKQTHWEEAATRLLLSNGSETEYVVDYFFVDKGKPAYAIVFSQHVPLPGGGVPTMSQYGRWLDDMRAISPPAVLP